ncbi:DUF2057 family protein [Acinetobacter pecorum]
MDLGIAATAAVFLFSTSAFSAVTVTVPEEIKIVAVNDQEVKSGFLRSNQAYTLNAGVNAISVRYNEFFQHSDNSHDILKSGVVTVKTPELIEGETYRLTLMNAPKDFEEAKNYKDQPIIELYDAKNQLLVQQMGAKETARPLFGKSILTRSVDLTSKAVTPVNQSAAVYTQVTVAPKTVNVKIAENMTGNQLDQQLIQVWQKASKVERQKFMTWLVEQAN